MNYIRISRIFAKLSTQAMKSCRLLALGMVAIFTSMALQPAQAQSSDTWKSIAIIGGSTAAGAYIGHKVAGPTGAWVGAGVGATTGYAIDRRRRANEYYNQYGDGGYYGNNGGYYGNDGGYYGNNGGYYGGPGDGYPYPAGFQSNKRTSHR
ncbi:MAG TPA: hypothetical protein VN517_12965 [Terriglobales bacterium]|nr:hypothetical protein [Terriglobales bacterium]